MRVRLFLAAALAVSFFGGVAADAPTKKQLPGVLYVMFNNSAQDFSITNPDVGPVGSVQWATWETINPDKGVYNFSAMDARLRAVEDMTITLADGSVVPHPVILQVFPYLSSASNWGYEFYDATPQWVYRQMGDRPTVGGKLVGHRLTGCGFTATMPAYDSYTWREAFYALIRALGERYDSNPQVVGVVIATGIDGETHATKNWHCQWESIIDAQAPGTAYRFSQFWRGCMDVYAEAFPTTQLWIDNVAGGSGTRKASSVYAANLGIGLQNSALTTDIDSHTGYGNWTGQWDMVRVYSDTLSINTETRMGYGSDLTHYWTYLAGLHYHPSVMTTHPDYLTQLEPALLGWVNGHIGVTIEDTPSVWTVLRDYEYPLQDWGAGGCSGKMGDWTFWMTRRDEPAGAMTVRTWVLPAHDLYDRQARRTDQANGNTRMVFDVADQYVRDAYRLRIVYADDHADTFSVEYGGRVVTVKKEGSGEWREVFMDLPGYKPTDDVVLSCNGDGDETVHMVELLGSNGPVPSNTPVTPDSSPTPTPSQTPTRTSTPTATATCTETRLPTSTKTATPTRAPTRTATPTPSPRPTKPCWTYQQFTYAERWSIVQAALAGIGRVGEIDMVEDETYTIGVTNEQLGAPLTRVFTVDGITCRGFCLGVVALLEDGRAGCRNYNVIGWDCEAKYRSVVE